MRILSLALSLAVSVICTAQVQIDETHMPAEGDVFPFATSVDAGTNDHTSTGANMTWDYSYLEAESFDADTFVSVESTPFAYQFFFNNDFLYPDYSADCALTQPDVNLGFVSFSDSYTYYKVDEAGYREVGYGANISGIPSSVRNMPIDWIYEFPLNMGDVFSGISANENQLPAIGYYGSELDRTTEVEGWGTLILPDATYDVLKLKVTIDSYDSVYTDALGQGFAFEQVGQVTYKWLSPAEVQPVLEVAIGDFNTTARYRADNPVLPDGLSDLLRVDVQMFPNPATEMVRVQSDDLNGLEISMCDLAGRTMKIDVDRDSNGANLHIGTLLPGHYQLILSDGARSWSSPLIIQ
jgi:hypothetical protein